ncbi:sodium:alanine symporter family protein [bacterium C-53]|nr:sodium:alanine symporter family protein [Lachnospiraceae bacterium]NBI03159.1 sodium:alanine symporter family protein [Lachnospiraceae bacterium]RKJ10053.1 sodium:alanine symporter family protein [bacterium C-53]
MESFIQTVTYVNGKVNGFVWGPIMLVFFLFVGFMFTVRTGVFQISHFKYWIDVTFLNIFRKKEVRKTQDAHAISQFQSLCTALAATIGTGNIAGVATAIVAGGPGAVFWMWLSAFLGTMTNFAENTLGIKYRSKNEKGEWVGGAMYYIERGLGWKWLAVIFSCFCTLASFGIGNMSQVNSIASGLKNSFDIDPRITAVILMIFVALVILGGIKRIASVTEKIVPFMAIAYIVGGLIVIFCNIGDVPGAFALIFREAFSFRSAAGGVAGYGISVAMRNGIARGVFSNEAGLGSSVMVHSASDVKEPVVQGMWGIFEVCADTLIVCTITALVILTSGVYNTDAYLSAIAAGEEVVSGAALTSNAFSSVIPHGDKFVAIGIMLFAFSTVLGWSFYGERAINYLFGAKAVPVYKVIFIIIIYFGCTASLDLVWDISDTFNGLMSIPNLIAVTLLSGEVIKLTKEYIQRVKSGKETETGEMIDE